MLHIFECNTCCHCIEEIQYQADYPISYFDFCSAPYALFFKTQIPSVSGYFSPEIFYQILSSCLPSQPFTQNPAPPQDIALISAFFILQILTLQTDFWDKLSVEMFV